MRECVCFLVFPHLCLAHIYKRVTDLCKLEQKRLLSGYLTTLTRSPRRGVVLRAAMRFFLLYLSLRYSSRGVDEEEEEVEEDEEEDE